jgi:topoisomerase IA-like protein
MDEAVQLIAERVAKGPAKSKGRRPAKKAKAEEAKPKPAKPKKPKPGGTREAAE